MNISEGKSPDFQVEEEVVQVIECNNQREVDSALKSTLRLSQHSNCLPGFLTGLKVAASKTGFAVELRMKRVGDRKASSGHQGPILKQGLEAYRLGKQLFANPHKINPVTVVEAVTGMPERLVVIKLYQCGFYGLNDVLQEALMQMKVESRNICRLLDISLRGEGKQFEVGLMMERLEGDLEADILQRASRVEAYEEAELLHILRDIADALVFAKLQGVAHRDIKPSNIYKDEYGYKLGDFGSACAVDQEGSSADGTLDYLSPEMRHRMLGEPQDVDFYQSDVFSLGITMLHLAKLTIPIKVADAWRQGEALDRAVQEELQGLNYSDSFQELLKQMLSSNPNARPQGEDILSQLIFKTPQSVLVSNSGSDDSEFQHPEDLLDKANQAFQDGNMQETEKNLLQALKVRAQLSKKSQWRLKLSLAYFYMHCSRQSESKALLEEMVHEQTENCIHIQADKMRIRMYLAEIYFGEGRISETESLLRMSSEANERILNDDRVSVWLLYTQGRLELCQGKMCEAEATIRHAFSLAKNCFQEKSQVVACIQALLGTVCSVLRKLTEGEELIRGSIDVLIGLHGETHHMASFLYLRLALNLLSQRRLEEAETLLEITLDLLQNEVDRNTFAIMNAELLLSEVCREQGRLQEAEKWLQASFKNSLSQSSEGSHFPVLFALFQINDQVQRQQWPEVEQLCTQVLQNPTNVEPIRSLASGYCYCTLGSLYRGKAKVNEAGICYDKSREEFAKVLPEGHLLLQEVDQFRAACYFLQGRFDEAKPLVSQFTQPNSGNTEQEFSMLDVMPLVSDFMTGNFTETGAKIQRIYAKAKEQLGEFHPYTQTIRTVISMDSVEISRLFSSAGC